MWESARKGIPRLPSDNHFKNPKKVLNILNKSANSKHDPNWTSNITLERSWRLNIECELTFSICSSFELGILAKKGLKIKPTFWLLTTKPWGPLMKVRNMVLKMHCQGIQLCSLKFFNQNSYKESMNRFSSCHQSQNIL